MWRWSVLFFFHQRDCVTDSSGLQCSLVLLAFKGNAHRLWKESVASRTRRQSKVKRAFDVFLLQCRASVYNDFHGALIQAVRSEVAGKTWSLPFIMTPYL